jgi:hypothetical protein
MCDQTVEYKGYQIVPRPTCGSDAMWFGGYDIAKDGHTIRSRANIFPGSLYFKAACVDSIEHARMEIDNLAPGPDSGIG